MLCTQEAKHADSSVCQVFWPVHCENARPGYLIGWNIRHSSCSVIAVVDAGALGTLCELEQRLATLSSDSQVGRVLALCTEMGTPPVVLGEWLGDGSDPAVCDGERCDAAGGSSAAAAARADAPRGWRAQARDKRQAADIWLTMAMQSDGEAASGCRSRPALQSIHCCGRLRRTAAHVITYHRVNKGAMHYLSTQPYNAPRPAGPLRRRSDMDFVVNQINVCPELERGLQRVLGCGPGEEPSGVSTEALPMPQNPAAAAAAAGNSLGRAEAALLGLLVHAPCACVRYAAGLFVWLAAQPLWRILPVVGGRPLKDVSLAIQVLDLRVREVFRWPLIYRRLRLRMQSEPAISAALSVEYMALLNSVCSAVLDWLAGLALCALLVLNSAAPKEGGWVLATTHHIGDALHIDMIRGQIKWLMGVPAGFKLNEPLNEQLGTVLLHTLAAWDSFTSALAPLESVMVVCAGCFGMLGCTVVLALASDILSLATAHVQLVFCTFSNVHKFQVRLLRSAPRLQCPANRSSDMVATALQFATACPCRLLQSFRFDCWGPCGSSFGGRRRTCCATASTRATLTRTSCYWAHSCSQYPYSSSRRSWCTTCSFYSCG